ncbi:MAG: preprotein translocase subunit SecG [Myxococcales bacterium]|nr:preprotein translocase subunit SecG [Myxococcales bacterium]
METALYILHIIVCLAMLPIILLQSGKGGGVSAVFGGGGGSSIMGTRGASNFLTRMTTGTAIIFMCTSLGLSVLSTRPGSVVGEIAPAAASTAPEGLEPDGQQVGAPVSPGLAPSVALTSSAAATPSAAEKSSSATGALEPPSEEGVAADVPATNDADAPAEVTNSPTVETPPSGAATDTPSSSETTTSPSSGQPTPSAEEDKNSPSSPSSAAPPTEEGGESTGGSSAAAIPSEVGAPAQPSVATGAKEKPSSGDGLSPAGATDDSSAGVQ